MDYFTVAREAAVKAAPARDATHFVEDTGYRQRSYLAICGTSVHAREMDVRSSGEPTCPTCKRMLAEFDVEECPF